jgi:uncharacterized DUF497 family protein
MTFEWDESKNLENIERHNVSFEVAQEAFYDKDRIIIKDKKHSKKEDRFFCIGNDGNGIVYEQKTVYTEAPKSISKEIADGEIIDYFLPPPEALIRKE